MTSPLELENIALFFSQLLRTNPPNEKLVHEGFCIIVQKVERWNIINTYKNYKRFSIYFPAISSKRNPSSSHMFDDFHTTPSSCNQRMRTAFIIVVESSCFSMSIQWTLYLESSPFLMRKHKKQFTIDLFSNYSSLSSSSSSDKRLVKLFSLHWQFSFYVKE